MLPIDMLGLGITGLSLKGGLIPILGADETERIGAMLARGAIAERATAGETIRQAVRGNAGFWKIGGGSGMAVINKITASLVGKYKNLQCKEFASDLGKLLDKEGIGYKTITIQSKRPIWSPDGQKFFPESGGIISKSGEHVVTRVGDIIYDNVHPQGISIKAFKDDIGISIDPNMFTKGLDLLN